MCCEDPAPGPAKAEGEEMARVYTVVPGAVVNLTGFGVATNDEPAHVPVKVAREFATSEEFRVEFDEGEEGPEEKPEEPEEKPAPPKPRRAKSAKTEEGG